MKQNDPNCKRSRPGGIPDPQVPEKKSPRRFTTQYKIKILKELDAATQPGQKGAILRREGLYSSSIVDWRRKREQGQLQGLSPKKRGSASRSKDPSHKRVQELEKENRRLQKKLDYANLLLDIQKKISEITKIPLKQVDFDEEDL